MKNLTNIISVLIIIIIIWFNYTSNVWAWNCSSCSSDSCSTSRWACINWQKTWTTNCTACNACNPPSSYWWCSPALWWSCDNWYLGFKTRWGSRNAGSSTIACQVCWNWYKEWTEQCDDSNLTNWDWCSSVCVTEYIDIWLKYFDWTSIIKIAIEPTWTVTSKLRIAKNWTIYGIVLVATTDPMASKFRINTSSWIKALRKL